jgi:hypothetical protein
MLFRLKLKTQTLFYIPQRRRRHHLQSHSLDRRRLRRQRLDIQRSLADRQVFAS